MTTCYLTVLKVLNETEIDELTQLLEAMHPSDPNVAEAIANNDTITFENVFEGDLKTFILQWFSKNKISFHWEWEAYKDVGAGYNFFDAEHDEMQTMRLHENLVVVPLGQAMNSDVVSGMQKQVARLAQLRKQLGIV